MRVVVVGAGVAGLACAVRLAHAGHRVVVLERAPAPGGKCGRVTGGGFTWDCGPSLLTMPWVLDALFSETGAPLRDELELLRVEPVTRYAFADGTRVDLSADPARSAEALEAWSPGAGAAWMRYGRIAAAMWRASEPLLAGPPPWPPRRPPAGAPAPDPRALLRVRPWHTLRSLAREITPDPRLRMVIERFATYAGADPRRAPAALAVAGWVEHAWGAWHPRGGMYEIVLALARRLEALGGELRCGLGATRILLRDGRAAGVETAAGLVEADAVVATADAETVTGPLLGRPPRPPRERSLSGFALMLGLRGRTAGLAHHTILFPRDYDAEFDDVFVHRRPVRDPTLYLACPERTEGGQDESLFLLANAPAFPGADWTAYPEHLLARLAARGIDVRERILARATRSPADLEAGTGAVGGAIYGVAPHGRLGTLKRPGPRVRGVERLWLAGGTVHPGGGLPLVMLGAATVAREIGPA